MTFSEQSQLAITILGSLGGGTLLLYALSNWIGKIWAERILLQAKIMYTKETDELRSRLLKDMEKYKDRINKSSILFDDKVAATKQIINIYRDAQPTFAYPDMDWHEACEQVARWFDKYLLAIVDFERKYGHLLSDEQIKMISDMISKCEVGRHEVDIEDSQVTKDGIKLAEEYLNMLEQLRKSLRDALLSDIST